MKYTAFGEIREMNGSSPTDYLYTGQRKEVEFGLSYYNARWLDSSLAHFTSADTLIPQPGDSGAWDRFAYVLNNPLKYIDPSGHAYYSGDDYEEGNWQASNTYNGQKDAAFYYKYHLYHEFDITISNQFATSESYWFRSVYQAAYNHGSLYAENFANGMSSGESFTHTQQPIYIAKDNERLNENDFCYGSGGGGCAASPRQINIWSYNRGTDPRDELERIVHMEHEFTHVLGQQLQSKGTGPYIQTGWYQELDDPYGGMPEDRDLWIQNSSITSNETIANLLPVYMHDKFPDTDLGNQNKAVLQNYLEIWLVP